MDGVRYKNTRERTREGGSNDCRQARGNLCGQTKKCWSNVIARKEEQRGRNKDVQNDQRYQPAEHS